MANPLHIITECNSDTDDDAERFLSRKQVCEITGLSYSTIWQMMRNNGQFPRAHIISKGGRVGWLKSTVVSWMRSRPFQTYKGV
jgi:predicted DNA-binding transcriptional regulator AlpA